MTVPLSYPGVYIEEMPSAVRSITGVATSITAFVGRAWRGTVDEPVTIFSFADFEREFGGLWRNSSLSYAVQQYFLNGGGQAIIVRTVNAGGGGSTAAAPATLTLNAGTTLSAANPGTWGRNLRVAVDLATSNPADANLFNLTIFDDPASALDSAARGGSGRRETFRNVSMDAASPRFVTKVLAEQSALVRVQTLGAARPLAQANVGVGNTTGSDGVLAGTVLATTTAAANEVIGLASAKTGMYALLKADLFNLLCIPPLVFARETVAPAFERIEADVPMPVWTAAATFCNEERALLLIDAPRDWTVANAPANIAAFSAVTRKSAALYFPRIRVPDPLRDNQLEDFAPAGAVAGIMARTDANRGVWKAPAGIEANLAGVLGLAINTQPASLTDQENGLLNPLGINCLRNLPTIGHVVWGARTLRGRRCARLRVEVHPGPPYGTVHRGKPVSRHAMGGVRTQRRTALGADPPQCRRLHAHSVPAGRVPGRQTPREAYFVKCDNETTTQTDIDLGIVNIVVGFAPLKPAEFVIIKIQQIALVESQA